VLLTAEGKMICDEGSHEFKVWDAVRRRGKLGIKELPVGVPGIGWLLESVGGERR